MGPPRGKLMIQKNRRQLQDCISESKKECNAMERKLNLFLEPHTLDTTDTIPKFNYSQNVSFHKVDPNKKDTAERG